MISVYFIQCGTAGPVKIGKAYNVPARRKSLQTAHHEELTIIRTISDVHLNVEGWLHRRYKHLKIRSEWFTHDPDMLVVIPPTEFPGTSSWTMVVEPFKPTLPPPVVATTRIWTGRRLTSINYRPNNWHLG